jgi:hypothetical protein
MLHALDERSQAINSEAARREAKPRVFELGDSAQE